MIKLSLASRLAHGQFTACSHIETSQLICTANQLIGFYMRQAVIYFRKKALSKMFEQFLNAPLINFIHCSVGNVNLCFGLFINPFQPSIVFNKETSHLFCSAKQMTGFYMRHSNGLKWINTFSEIKKQFLLNLLVFNLQIGTDATTTDTRKMKFSYNRFLHSNLQRAYNLPIILQRLVSIT